MSGLTCMEPIVDHLREIAEHDPEELAGIRTTAEIGRLVGITKEAARWRLDKLEDSGKVECLGTMLGEAGRPVGWKYRGT